jgi:hypothetical protein
MVALSATSPLAHLRAAFLTILPRIERHGQIYFRHVRCPQSKDDAIAEMIALSWRWFLRLIAKGKDPLAFPMMLATYAARQVNEGRRLVRKEKGKDVLSSCAQKQHGFLVESLPSSMVSSFEVRYTVVRGQQKQDVFEERLRDNTQTPVPDQVCFRIDFPAWLETLTPRERRLVHEMANNERTLDLSQRFELSPGRISQKRRELHDDWTRFCGELHDSSRRTTPAGT